MSRAGRRVWAGMRESEVWAGLKREIKGAGREVWLGLKE